MIKITVREHLKEPEAQRGAKLQDAKFLVCQPWRQRWVLPE